eukprot:CAMPEP_0203757644 /NCGR_PEP_ID=MMETSP0098-20131031/10609_1 /ASSEMBLY_ACC=CAM_ASM_000208 /TAXON_ID=96639 /ORGANISM=" , Strain NY0313808BC1" /LENGTH=402 /DNA_ID=CAMNT_0050649871 /DNA_START=170 /DNA_END=1375 /DNA_ORIENTATION=-
MIVFRLAIVGAIVTQAAAFEARSLEDAHAELRRLLGIEGHGRVTKEVQDLIGTAVGSGQSFFGNPWDKGQDVQGKGVLKAVSAVASEHGSSFEDAVKEAIKPITGNSYVHPTRMWLAQQCMKMILSYNEASCSQKHCVKMQFTPSCLKTDEERLGSLVVPPKKQLANATTTKGRRMSNFIDARRLDVPDKVNWLEQGYIIHPDDQAQCGGCWAFSSMSTIEGRLAIKTNRTFRLSVQQLISCYTKPVTRPGEKQRPAYGCTGGNFADVFYHYALQNTYASDTSFGFTESAETVCSLGSALNVSNSKGYKSLGWDFKHWQETGEDGSVLAATNEQIREAVEQGPVSIAIFAGRRCFSLYKSGILSRESCSEPVQTQPFYVDHAVSIVGYENYGSTDPNNPPVW